MVWKMSKHFEYLKERKVPLEEDLTPDDNEKQNSRWPVIQQAHQERRITYFVKGRVYVDNKTDLMPAFSSEDQFCFLQINSCQITVTAVLLNKSFTVNARKALFLSAKKLRCRLLSDSRHVTWKSVL